VKIISGELNNVTGPVQDLMVKPEYLDVTLQTNTTFDHHITPGHRVFSYVIDGKGTFENKQADAQSLVIFKDGDTVSITAGEETLRFLLISGKPLREPIAWHGPIVMNTQQELTKAFAEYQEGTFIKKQAEE